MSSLVFLVRGRSIDLVAMSAAHALRSELGLGDRLVALRRDAGFVFEGVVLGREEPWIDACVAQPNWFNPNKHRFAVLRAQAGIQSTMSDGAAWPQPWLSEILATDRTDLETNPRASAKDVLWRWIAPPDDAACHGCVFAVWDLESGVSRLPAGHWPNSDQPVLSLHLWTLIVRAGDSAQAQRMAEDAAITRHRRQGLLVHPQMEGWSWVAPAKPLAEEASTA